MDDQSKPAPRKSTRRIAMAMGRSLVSTAIVVIVAVGVFVFREGYLSIQIFRDVVVENGSLFTAVFLGFVIWDLRFRSEKPPP